MKQINYKDAYENVMIANKMLEQEIERLHNIIKEALILIENIRYEEQYVSDGILLPILNKLRESGIINNMTMEEYQELLDILDKENK